ncbi:MAG: divalent-cation tolerance protein CutA [Planctomycetota bacterium]|nr:divalent-cation tolerance protein CutA [Planctomycetota bacterium]
MRMALSTCPPEHAERIADDLLRLHLVACVNIIPGANSRYWWEGAIQSESESILIMKTRAEHIPALTRALQDIHPYEVPELITFQIQEGSQDYLDWLTQSTVLPENPS